MMDLFSLLANKFAFAEITLNQTLNDKTNITNH